MQVVFYGLNLGHTAINAWFGGMYQAFFDALTARGLTATYCPAGSTPRGDVLVVPVGGGQDRLAAQAMAAFRGPVILYVPSARDWFREGFLARWSHRLLFVYGSDEAPRTRALYARLGVAYYCLPFASEPNVMRPLALDHQFDVIFVGNARSGEGRAEYIEALVGAVGRERMMVIGPGWQYLGFPEQSVAWGPLLNTLYGLAAVCVNVHNVEQWADPRTRLDANNRLFDLAMAGRTQVCTGSPVVRPYFDDHEVVTADSPDELCAAVTILLADRARARALGQAARQRALRDHSWTSRSAAFVQWIEDARRQGRPGSGWSPLSLGRLRDLHLPPYGLAEAGSKARRRLLLRAR
jgi:hypothetical protein